MYKQLIALVLILALIVWVYVTILINKSYNNIEAFSDIEPNTQDIDYLKKITSDLNEISNYDKSGAKSENKTKNGIAPVIDTLKNFVETATKTNKVPSTNKPRSKPNSSCRFMPSYSETFTCPEKYSQHLGAVFGAKAHTGISCNGKKFTAETAKAYAIVKDGKIEKIKLISKGTHYFKPPKIKIIGKGHGASAKAVLDLNSSVKSIKITSPGTGYTSSPKIIIGNPDGYLYCHLCCNL